MTSPTRSGVSGTSTTTRPHRPVRWFVLALVVTLLLAAAGCGDDTSESDTAGGSSTTSESSGTDPATTGAAETPDFSPPAAAPTLVIGGIPDQDVSVLEERFGGMAEYLSDETGIDVEYRPSTDYAALVTAFANGDVLLGWFGGLTGVQARTAVAGAEAVVQRPIDTEFRSVFVVGADVDATELTDLVGLTFTFGSESSTSGHLMPRYFLDQAGIDPEVDFDGGPGYSGSHDTTWKQVESGQFDAGALNRTVWDGAVEAGEVDTDAVRELVVTDPYVDYHWVAHPDIDEVYGEGATGALVAALLGAGDDPAVAEVLALFDTDEFIPTASADYAAIEEVALELGLLGES